MMNIMNMIPYRKFKNTPTYIGEYRFASKAEAKRFQELLLLAKSKIITKLRLQPRFKLSCDGQPICTYVADFGYEENGHPVAEDVKGFQTPEFKIKWKLAKINYPYMDFRLIK